MSIETGAGAGIALLKAYGFKVAVGMVGAALMYFVLPPKDANGEFDQREFVLRLACAGVFSSFFGDLVIEMLEHGAPWIKWAKHTGAVYLMTGAPAWWFSRAIALMAHNRRNKDMIQLITEYFTVTKKWKK